MENLTAVNLADSSVRLGLLTSHHVQEAWDELGSREVPPEQLLRCLERKGHLTPFQSSKLMKGDKDGFFLGGYRILYKIASGSFGRVYRADDPSTGRVVAIKVLRRKWTEDKRKVEMFVREGKMGMSLHHPNIVEIISVAHDKVTNQHYIVMEFVEGGNLRNLLNIRKKLQPLEVMKILEETTSALVCAFARGVTHRDMKLTNVLLSSQGPVKLVDFGLAGGQFGFEDMEADNTVDRTVDYAGLEKATGAPHGDPRSDLFFLGCVAYELLTGRSPLEMNRSAQARMNAQRFQKIPPMKPEEVQAPPSVFRLIENMMQIEPHLRFQTPSQLLERIRETRIELEGKSSLPGAKAGQRTIFLVESDEQLQDVLRTKLKEQGYRILIASEPTRALERFRQQPFDLLIVDANTTGENGFYVFERIMEDVRKQDLPCSGILMLAEEQAELRDKVKGEGGNFAVLVHPVKYKQLLATIKQFV
jgi:serine/threonine protein kinase